MTTYECWVRGCKLNHSLVSELEKSNRSGTGLYRVTSEYTMNGKHYYRTPVYMLWWNDKNVYSGLDYQEAIGKWNRLISEEI